MTVPPDVATSADAGFVVPGLPALLALLQLASPALPVGGFAYSQGLEGAVEEGRVRDEAGARAWIADLLTLVVARHEAPLWLRAFDAAARCDAAALAGLNDLLRASRETAELRAESEQMGGALCRAMPALGLVPPPLDPVAWPVAFAAAAVGLRLPREAALAAYLWSWAENQVLVAVKCVPLGQQAGQRILFALHGDVQRAVAEAASLRDAEIGTCASGFALVSARHETQYSRLFRS